MLLEKIIIIENNEIRAEDLLEGAILFEYDTLEKIPCFQQKDPFGFDICEDGLREVLASKLFNKKTPAYRLQVIRFLKSKGIL